MVGEPWLPWRPWPEVAAGAAPPPELPLARAAPELPACDEPDEGDELAACDELDGAEFAAGEEPAECALELEPEELDSWELELLDDDELGLDSRALELLDDDELGLDSWALELLEDDELGLDSWELELLDDDELDSWELELLLDDSWDSLELLAGADSCGAAIRRAPAMSNSATKVNGTDVLMATSASDGLAASLGFSIRSANARTMPPA